jgi:glycosyltransferase involved in cell wall biosynthesis
MRIAFVTEVFLPKIDGITNRLRHTIETLSAGGHEVLVIAPEDAVDEHAGARVVRVPGPAFPPYPGLRISLPDPRIAWELARFAPDVVHAVGPACLGIWGSLAARSLNLPLIASYHTDFPRYLPGYGLEWVQPALWPLIRSVHNLASRNLAPSRFTCDELRQHGVESVGLWRGGVDTERFHPDKRSLEMRMRLTDGRPDRPVMLYVGRVSPEKNLGVLARILDATPGLTCAIVGDGPARAELERETFAGRDARFLGFLRGEELAAAFASADVFVMPSRTETLGFVVLEAMSAGCPVVAARAGGIPDLVDHDETGLLYDPDCEEEAVAAVQELVAHRGRRAFHARLARKKAEEGSWAAETENLLDQYRRTIARHRSRSRVARLRRMLFA